MCPFVAVVYRFESVNESAKSEVAYQVCIQVTAWQNDVEHDESGFAKPRCGRQVS